MYVDIWFILIFPIFLNLRRREYIPKLGNVDEIRMNHISTYIIRKEILRWFRIWSQKFISAYAFRRKSCFKNLRGRFYKIFIWLNPKSNFHSKYVHILMFALSWTLEFFMFEKSNFCNYVIWRYSGTVKFQSGQYLSAFFHIFQSIFDLQLQYLHTSALNLIFGFFDFAWAGDCVGGWLMAKMKENFIAHILIPMWVFNLMCKLV